MAVSIWEQNSDIVSDRELQTFKAKGRNHSFYQGQIGDFLSINLLRMGLCMIKFYHKASAK